MLYINVCSYPVIFFAFIVCKPPDKKSDIVYAVVKHVEAAIKVNVLCRKRLRIEKKWKESASFVHLAYYTYVDNMSWSEENNQVDKMLRNASFD